MKITLFKKIFILVVLLMGLATSYAQENDVSTIASEQSIPQGLYQTDISSKDVALMKPAKLGVDYTILAPSKRQAAQSKNAPEVVEFAWYGCPHCYKVDPFVNSWKATLPRNVKFTRLFTQWTDKMQVEQRMGFTAQVLKIADFDKNAFLALNEQKFNFSEPAQRTLFLNQQHINIFEWNAAYQSPQVDSMMEQSDLLFEKYGLQGVPAFIVNGKYMVSGDSIRVVQTINWLIKKK